MRAAVSIDLDELRHYAAIHGLEPGALPTAPLAGTLAVERALAWAARRGMPLTFFVVAADLEHAEVRATLRRALAAGHEVASHSATHPYDLVRGDRPTLDREVAGSFDAIEAALGVRPAGFRAPGYLVNEAVFDALERAGAAYDASVFGCPLYDAAKLVAMGGMRLAGRASRAVVGDPAVWAAPTQPYRPGRSPYARGARPFVEIPMAVTRGPRLPVIGTSLGLAGPAGARALVRALGRPPVVSLELHAIDLLDAEDGLGALRGHQPELARPRAARLAAFDAALDALDGYAFTTLASIAASAA